MSGRPTAIIQATVVVLAGSFAGVLAKLALGEVAPFTFAWLQAGVALMLVGLVLAQSRRRLWRRHPGPGSESP